jgi:hypothetical protein
MWLAVPVVLVLIVQARPHVIYFSVRVIRAISSLCYREQSMAQQQYAVHCIALLHCYCDVAHWQCVVYNTIVQHTSWDLLYTHIALDIYLCSAIHFTHNLL